MINVAVCCIGRQENRYINEFIEHYLTIGVDKIFLYDNNYNDEEYFQDVIPQELLNNQIEIIDYRNKSICQLNCYQDCYNKHNQEYDWILFIDCDEFLYMNDFDNIKDFLSQDKFNNYQIIHVNWMVYSDNDNILFEDKPLKERFTEPVMPLNWSKTLNIPENNLIKSIIRGGIKDIKWISTPHTPYSTAKCCNASGKMFRTSSYLNAFDFTSAHLKHYTTKTIEEWLDIKTKRGFPDGNKNLFKRVNIIDEFFRTNKVTKEKIHFLENRGFNVDYLYDICEKTDDIIINEDVINNTN